MDDTKERKQFYNSLDYFFFLRMTQNARVILQSLIAFFISTVPIILSLLHTICHILQLWQTKEQYYIVILALQHLSKGVFKIIVIVELIL